MLDNVIKKAEEFIKGSSINIAKSDSSLDETLKKLEILQKDIGSNFNITFAFDTTASMYHYIEKVGSNIEKVGDELLTRENSTYIMVAGVGEYGDDPTLQIKPYSNNRNNIKHNIQSIRKTCGMHPVLAGTGQVSLELLFQELNKDYISGIDNALVIITDQIAHGQDTTVPNPKADYRRELSNLKKHLKGFYFVSCTENDVIMNLQKQLVNPLDPNEKFIKFDDFNILTELLIALTKKSISNDEFDDYMNRLKRSTNSDKIAAEKIRGYLK